MAALLTPGAFSVAGYRLVVNPPARLRKQSDCTNLFREHLSAVVYKTVLKRFPEDDGRAVYFEVSSLEHEMAFNTSLGRDGFQHFARCIGPTQSDSRSGMGTAACGRYSVSPKRSFARECISWLRRFRDVALVG